MAMTTENLDRADAIRTDLGAIFVSLELSRAKWLVTSLLPGGGKLSQYTVKGGDFAGLCDRLARLVGKAKARSGRTLPVIVIQEAGLDGFWIHRALEAQGIESHVVDPASIAVPRRRRRVKTDRIDGEILVRTLLAFKRGEPRVCSMLRPPTPAQEDRRRLMREYKDLTGERVRCVNRIRGLLLTLGILDYRPLRRDRRQRLSELQDGQGCVLGPHLKAEIGRLLDRLELLLKQMKALIAELRALIAEAQAANAKANAEDRIMAQLVAIRGIGPVFAAALVGEGLFRQFDNRRQVAAYAGLAPSPWKSGSIDYEQGVSKAGNKRLRTTMVQVAWLWLRHQPKTALARWFEERVAHNGGRLKKVMIIALARKLLVALWKYVTQGVVIEGMVMTAA